MTYTPMMRQYLKIKEQYSDCILFFRLGDFYEMFFDDAITASKVLDITLTGRDAGAKERVPMCGVPFHSVDSYIAKMVANGYKVAICEQVEDPKTAKGIVKRQVTRVITPGTVMEGQLLDEKKNNYIVSILIAKDRGGLAFADISTGEFMVSELTGNIGFDELINELTRLQPAEILMPYDLKENEKLVKSLQNHCSAVLNYYRNDAYDAETALSYVERQFSKERVEQLGLPADSLSIVAAGALVQFLLETQKRDLKHIREIKYYSVAQYLVLDAAARRNLELTRTLITNDKKGSLLWVLDFTATAMGGRLLKKWIEQPLVDVEQINARLDAVGELAENLFLREDLRSLLKEVYDLERLSAKVAYGSANARDLLAIKNSLSILPAIKEQLTNTTSKLLNNIAEEIDVLADLTELLEKSINDDPPLTLRDGGIIKDGYSSEVDKLREAATNGKSWLARLEAAERQRTGIKSLKIRFNKVFGYYIEVTKSNLSAVPKDYQRRQTLANAERFITPKLKEYEDIILGAQDKLVDLEYNIFTEIRETVASQISRIQNSAAAVAKVDVLVSLAEAAVKHNYVRPVVNNSGKLLIIDGRHPVVELTLGENEFVPNDTELDENNYMALITGPNMGGKSTYQRQVALITIMAQMGGFVPARRAEIGVVDRIFARVGASDDLSSGRSTFMVEMQECNNALRNATKNSLVIIDELGRGTSNLEGMAIAQAVIEYLHDTVGCRTLFSTHYHELAELENNLGCLKNYAVAVEEKGDDVVFLHRAVPGKASKSYGVHCARLAGLPGTIIDRANQLVANLEIYRKAAEEVISGEEQPAAAEEPVQMQLFSIHPEAAEILSEIERYDLLNTTPLKALNILFELQSKVRKLHEN